MGFFAWVEDQNGAAARARPSLVTLLSCIASSSAAWGLCLRGLSVREKELLKTDPAQH